MDDRPGISRRAVLAGAAGGLVAGLTPPASAAAVSNADAVPFFGLHQQGITTPQPDVVYAARSMSPRAVAASSATC